MTEAQNIQNLVSYVRTLKGDEKGEAQVFCDRLFQAFGHEGYKEAGATLEERLVRKGKHVRFVDLIWKPRLLLEMKSRKENLGDHYQQIFEYWLHSVPQRPRYVVLCNFDEFWIYEFDEHLAREAVRKHEAEAHPAVEAATVPKEAFVKEEASLKKLRDKSGRRSDP
jgi:hypothetical protein